MKLLNLSKINIILPICIFIFYYPWGQASPSSLGIEEQETYKLTCPEALSSQNINAIVDETAQLYLDIFHGYGSAKNDDILVASAYYEVLWRDKIDELETEFPGISKKIKKRIYNLLPEHLKHFDDETKQVREQKAIEEEELDQYREEEVNKKWDICRRTPQVQEALTSILYKPCEEITKEDLETIISLDLSDKNISNLYEYDFYGLTNLEYIVFRNNPLSSFNNINLQGLPPQTTIWFGVKNLKANSFQGLSQIQKLSLKSSIKAFKIQKWILDKIEPIILYILYK